MTNKPTNEEKSPNRINKQSSQRGMIAGIVYVDDSPFVEESVLEQIAEADFEALERFRLDNSGISPSRALMFNDRLSRFPLRLDSEDPKSE